jgi:uncharacterized membrane protein YraQ (UPF0718 family)
MNQVLSYLGELFYLTLKAVGATLLHNWKILAFAILTAVILKTYVNSDKLSKALLKRKKVSIFASVAFGAFTPLCACGTTAVLVGMMTTALPWGPIMAFLTSSPMMSPDGFVLIAGVIGTKFAIALTVASLIIGIASGFITNIIEKKSNFLVGQSRFTDEQTLPACACGSEADTKTIKKATSNEANKATTGCSCGSEAAADIEPASAATGCSCGSSTEIAQTDLGGFRRFIKKLKLREFVESLYTLGFRQILVFYTIFVAVGFMINYFIPSSIITVLFGADAFYAVPLASIIGLPLYITTDSGIPIIKSMLDSGAREGAMLAFMITGSATSSWVIAGLSTFMKKRAILLYVSFVMVGGILCGYLLDFIDLFI